MNTYSKYSFVHYFFHVAIAISFLVTLIFSESVFPHEITYGSNLTFGQRTVAVEGTAYKSLNFEKKKIQKKDSFFLSETFETLQDSGLDLSFSDFTILRSGQNTIFNVLPTDTPEISLQQGKIWVSTQEYVVTHLPQATVETLAGSAVINNTDGNITVTAWNMPSRITFLSPEGSVLWKFLLPSGHQVSFAAKDYFSAKAFSQFRFSKLKKEFPIQISNSTPFIEKNIALDKGWKSTVLRHIEQRKSLFFNPNLSASLFNFSVKKREKEEQQSNREAAITIWDTLNQKRFAMMEHTMRTFDPRWKKNFYKYAGFFPEDKKANTLFIKSFDDAPGEIWKDLWSLERIIAYNTNPLSRDTLQKKILEAIDQHKYDTEEIQFFAISLLKNYTNEISHSSIDFFYALNTLLIQEETNPKRVITRKLEIIQDVFAVTDVLVKQKKYLLSRKLLDTVEEYIADDTSSLLSQTKEKIRAQKEYIRGKVEYAEILGDDDVKKLKSYLSIKEVVKEQSDQNRLHAAAKTDNSLADLVTLLKSYDIIVDTDTIVTHNDILFEFQKAKNKGELIFSGLFSPSSKTFSHIVFFDDNGKEISEVSGYAFSLSDLSLLKKETLDTIIKSKKEEDNIKTEEEYEKLPSEISDFVFTIAQEKFRKQDLRVIPADLVVTSISTAKIKEAIPHYEAIEAQKIERKKKKKLSKNAEVYALKTATLQKYEEYTLSFEYNIEDHMASQITATAYNKPIILEGSRTVSDMIQELDSKVRDVREKYEYKEQAQNHLKLIGINAEIKDMRWTSKEFLEIQNMKEFKTQVVFNGIYNPSQQYFSRITFQNISDTLITLDKKITLSEIKEDFASQRETLSAKVKKYSDL